MTQVWGVTMFRDEADVARPVIEHMVEEGLTGIIVADNGSVDSTKADVEALVEWAERKGCRLIVQDDPERAYYQSEKMSRLAAQAAAEGADWIVPFDADEVWFSRRDRIGEVLRAEKGDIVMVPLFNHFCTAVDSEDLVPFRRIQWRQKEAAPLHKVAFRYREGVQVHQGNHGVTYPPHLPRFLATPGILEVRHFPYRSRKQFISKARNGAEAYRATNLHETEGAHWRQYGALLDRFGESALCDVFAQHFFFLSPIDSGLIHDPAPFCRWR